VARISVTANVFDGNMGVGWADNYQAACRFAEFMKAAWRADLAHLAAAGHEIEVDIGVLGGTSGTTRPATTLISHSKRDETFNLRLAVNGALTSESTLLEEFRRANC
jgi:hypothetical protein